MNDPITALTDIAAQAHSFSRPVDLNNAAAVSFGLPPGLPTYNGIKDNDTNALVNSSGQWGDLGERLNESFQGVQDAYNAVFPATAKALWDGPAARAFEAYFTGFSDSVASHGFLVTSAGLTMSTLALDISASQLFADSSTTGTNHTLVEILAAAVACIVVTRVAPFEVLWARLALGILAAAAVAALVAWLSSLSETSDRTSGTLNTGSQDLSGLKSDEANLKSLGSQAAQSAKMAAPDDWNTNGTVYWDANAPKKVGALADAFRQFGSFLKKTAAQMPGNTDLDLKRTAFSDIDGADAAYASYHQMYQGVHDWAANCATACVTTADDLDETVKTHKATEDANTAAVNSVPPAH